MLILKFYYPSIEFMQRFLYVILFGLQALSLVGSTGDEPVIYGRSWSTFIADPGITVFTGPTSSYNRSLRLEEWSQILDLPDVRDNIGRLQQIFFSGCSEPLMVGCGGPSYCYEDEIVEAILQALGPLGVESLEFPGRQPGAFMYAHLLDCSLVGAFRLQRLLKNGRSPDENIIFLKKGSTAKKCDITGTFLTLACTQMLIKPKRVEGVRNQVAVLVSAKSDTRRRDSDGKTPIEVLCDGLSRREDPLRRVDINLFDDVAAWLLRLENPPENFRVMTTDTQMRVRRKRLKKYHDQGFVDPQIYGIICEKLPVPAADSEEGGK